MFGIKYSFDTRLAQSYGKRGISYLKIMERFVQRSFTIRRRLIIHVRNDVSIFASILFTYLQILSVYFI
jgi:hypothetical protein